MIRYLLAALLMIVSSAQAQVYSPVVTRKGQVDASDLSRFARGICERADANTDREKAEAIWRFFLTDGRFVKPGFWYHIAGWAYEEPKGEVLDVMKLLNSYGFGLCYHIAPLLEAVYEAAGFADARVWFLTGHTVAEVFYDGAYHYFDSDMLGYNAVGSGPLKQRRVASVHDIEQNGQIITGTLLDGKADPGKADDPWYPADVRANAIGGLASLFTSKDDNHVYPFTRYATGHTMDFVLRPGEKMIRYFQPERSDLFYLPYACDDKGCREFPQEFAQYSIKTSNGPKSQKDSRLWATGRLEYKPQVGKDTSSFTVSMPSPYVIIDAEFQLKANVPAGDSLTVETSTDEGRSWEKAGSITGPHQGRWQAEPRVIVTSEHGRHTAVSGTYGYLVRFTSTRSEISDLLLTTRFQLNPRTLPTLTSGRNELTFRSTTETRVEHPVLISRYREFAFGARNVEYKDAGGQGYLRSVASTPGIITFELTARDGGTITRADVGGRFLDLRDGFAPDKFTAEVRSVERWPTTTSTPRASLAWSTKPEGPWQTVWTYDAAPRKRDGEEIDRMLRWPEVDKRITDLPDDTRKLYVRYTLDRMALDDVRLATVPPSTSRPGNAVITHVWKENGVVRQHAEVVSSSTKSYGINIPAEGSLENVAIIIESSAQQVTP